MQTLFVQVKCELGRVYDVAEQVIVSGDKVSEIHSTSGQFDLLIKCYLDDEEDIGRFISDKIQPIDGVRDPYTIITFKAFS